MSTGEEVSTAAATRQAAPPADASPWAATDVWDRLAAWEKKSPTTAAGLLEQLKVERRHAHRIEWAHWAKQLLGTLLGFGSVLVMAAVAWHYADIGAPLNGAVVMSAGTASVVAIFVTGRYIGRGR